MPKDTSHLAEILRAIHENNIDDVKQLIKVKLKSLNKDRSTNSPTSSFTFSCMSDNVTKQHKNDLEVIIMKAALQKDPTILIYLIRKGLNINFAVTTSSFHGYFNMPGGSRTPLHAAVYRGYHDVIDALLDGNANINAKDNEGRSPLHLVAMNCDVVAVRMLLSHGAHVKTVDKYGKTALQYASKYGHVDLIRELLEHNAEIFEDKQKGFSPLHIAALEGHVPLIDMFAYCVDIDTLSTCDDENNEQSALHLACQQGLLESVRFMVERFAAKVNIRDSLLNNPLHYTVMYKHDPRRVRRKECFSAVAEYLLKANVCVNQQNSAGDTPLHLSARNQHHKITELLLMSGATPHLKNKSGYTAKELIPEYDATMKQVFVRCAPFSAAYITLSGVISNTKTAASTTCERISAADKSELQPPSSSQTGAMLSSLLRKTCTSDDINSDIRSSYSSVSSGVCPSSQRENLLHVVTDTNGVQKYKTVVHTSYDI